MHIKKGPTEIKEKLKEERIFNCSKVFFSFYIMKQVKKWVETYSVQDF